MSLSSSYPKSHLKVPPISGHSASTFHSAPIIVPDLFLRTFTAFPEEEFHSQVTTQSSKLVKQVTISGYHPVHIYTLSALGCRCMSWMRACARSSAARDRGCCSSSPFPVPRLHSCTPGHAFVWPRGGGRGAKVELNNLWNAVAAHGCGAQTPLSSS